MQKVNKKRLEKKNKDTKDDTANQKLCLNESFNSPEKRFYLSMS